MHPGFAAAATDFFGGLASDNSREYWAAHRRQYDDDLKPVFAELVTGVGGGPWRHYRPNNDTRFAATPYKTFLGAVTEDPDGVGAFIQVGVHGLLVGTGIPMPAADQLQRLRAAVADETAGAGLLGAVAAAEATGARVHGGRWPPLSRTPRGFPSEHPRAGWLRWKGIEVSHKPGAPSWLDTPAAPGHVRELIERGAAVHEWLARHVGPSSLSPEERFGRGRGR